MPLRHPNLFALIVLVYLCILGVLVAGLWDDVRYLLAARKRRRESRTP